MAAFRKRSRKNVQTDYSEKYPVEKDLDKLRCTNVKKSEIRVTNQPVFTSVTEKKVVNTSPRSLQDKRSSIWDNLGDDVKYMEKVDWANCEHVSQLPRKSVSKAISIKENREKGKNKSTSVSRQSHSVNIRRCRRCALDCEYGAYLRGDKSIKSFTINKTTCPKIGK